MNKIKIRKQKRQFRLFNNPWKRHWVFVSKARDDMFALMSWQLRRSSTIHTTNPLEIHNFNLFTVWLFERKLQKPVPTLLTFDGFNPDDYINAAEQWEMLTQPNKVANDNFVKCDKQHIVEAEVAIANLCHGLATETMTEEEKRFAENIAFQTALDIKAKLNQIEEDEANDEYKPIIPYGVNDSTLLPLGLVAGVDKLDLNRNPTLKRMDGIEVKIIPLKNNVPVVDVNE